MSKGGDVKLVYGRVGGMESFHPSVDLRVAWGQGKAHSDTQGI